MKRLVAYCRVSTEANDQLNSLDNQKQYFEQYIDDNTDGDFCGLYTELTNVETTIESLRKLEIQRHDMQRDACKCRCRGQGKMSFYLTTGENTTQSLSQ